MKTKKYYKKDFKRLTHEERGKVFDLINRGVGVYAIIKQVDVSISSLTLLFSDIAKPVSKLKLGYKNDTYCSEDEMIQGYQIPTYDELSESEKNIYNLL